jgi:hypothetical protein
MQIIDLFAANSIMKKMFLFISIALFTIQSRAQINANWTDKQLMEPSELAGIINNHDDSIIIISVGPFNSIPGSIHVGMVSEQQGLDKLKAQLGIID